MIPVQEYINHFIQIWESSPNSFPQFDKAYSQEEQMERECNYEKFHKKIKELQGRKQVRQLRKDPGQSLFPLIKNFLETVFDFDKEHLSIILADEFKDVSRDFYYKARDFGPELKHEHVYQGMRNVWIMNGVQFLAHVPVKITPSVFAYSMIYPYSDNLLDNTELTDDQKQQFSDRFNYRLHGEEVVAESFIEEQLYKLVRHFEEEFPRNEFPMVYESLYAIQKGQTNSLKMINANGLSDEHILSICFEKGGASVLADGYLVAGKLSREQERALFGYGIYLQLLDDIQDLKEDVQANTKTMFSFLSEADLGALVNKTIHFGRTIIVEMRCFPEAKNSAFLDLMNWSIEKMLIESVGLNNNRYEQDYLIEIEKYSPLHFAFVREKRAQSKSQRFALFQKYINHSSI